MLTAAGRFRQHWSMSPELFTEGPDPDSILVVEDDIALRAEEEEKVALLDAGAKDFDLLILIGFLITGVVVA